MTVPPHNPDDPWAGFRRDRASIAGDWQRALGPLRTEEQIRRDLAAPHRATDSSPAPKLRDYWANPKRLGSKPLTPQDCNDTDSPSPSLPWPFVAAVMLAAALAIVAAAGLITLAAMLGWLG